MQKYPKRAKLLLLLKYFESQTDEQSSKTMEQILNHLQNFNITAERKSIYADMALLRDMDYEIIKTFNDGEAAYYLNESLFDQAEAEIFASAVCAAKFVTQKKSSELLDKIASLFSKRQAKVFRQRVELARTQKTNNVEVYYNIDKIVTAMNGNKQISFLYFEYLPDKTQQMRKEGNRYFASPYSLIWSEDALYAVTNLEKYNNLTHFRVDRMKKVEIIDANARDIKEVSEYKNHLDYDEYQRSVFSMFGGKLHNVRIRFHESLATAVFDRFGLDVPVGEIKKGWFTISTKVRVSPGFLSWITLFGDQIEVLSPNSLRSEIKEMLLKLSCVYND